MDIFFEKIDSIDITELANLLYISRRNRNELEENQNIEHFTDILEKTFKRYQMEIFILAKINNELVGWLALYKFTDLKIAHLINWQPYVISSENSKTIAKELVKQAIFYSKSNDQKQITVDLTNINATNETQFFYLKELYQEFNIVEINQENQYHIELENLREEESLLPKGYSLSSIHEVNADLLFQCWNEVFSQSKDRFYHNMDVEGRKEFFNSSWNPTNTIIDKASFVLMEKQKIIGFSRVLPIYGDDDGCLSPIAIHPNYRGKGLGFSLLFESMRKLAKAGYRTMTLFVDSSNFPAIKLYRKLNFQHIGKIVSFLGDL